MSVRKSTSSAITDILLTLEFSVQPINGQTQPNTKEEH